MDRSINSITWCVKSVVKNWTASTGAATSMPNADVVIVSAAGMDGGNGGWPVMYGAAPLTTTSLTMVFDEDQVRDSERNHVNEQVAYIVFGQ